MPKKATGDSIPTESDDKIPVENDSSERYEAEMNSLKAELAELKRTQQVSQQVPLSDEQLQQQAEQMGFTDPKQVRSIGQIAAHVAAPAYKMANELKAELATEKAVSAAKRAAMAADPQFSKIEAHVDEFLAAVPPEEKTDPIKLKAQMERATFYAKGKIGSVPERRATPPPRVRDEGDEGLEPGEIPAGEGEMKGSEQWQTRDGNFRLNIEPLVSDAVRKMHRHPDFEGGVLIDPREEWKGPIFAKDVKGG